MVANTATAVTMSITIESRIGASSQHSPFGHRVMPLAGDHNRYLSTYPPNPRVDQSTCSCPAGQGV